MSHVVIHIEQWKIGTPKLNVLRIKALGGELSLGVGAMWLLDPLLEHHIHKLSLPK